jgi:hypothetical protein
MVVFLESFSRRRLAAIRSLAMLAQLLRDAAPAAVLQLQLQWLLLLHQLQLWIHMLT